MSWYCDIAPGHPFHGPYHDEEYGFPLRDNDGLFERQSLEIMQAGLSWLTVLKKRSAMRSAFDQFHIDKVAAYGEVDVERLLADSGIIRNRLKVLAIIENARRLQKIIADHGSFAAWMDAQEAQSKEDWVRLFRKTFKFMGGEIVGEFLMSIGRLPGAHRPDCPVFIRLTRESQS